MIKTASLGLRLMSFILFIIFSRDVHAQQDYIPGYVVDMAGDTTRGYIDYWKGRRNPEKIYFKKDLNGKTIKYIPSEIKRFVVEGAIYVSAIVDRSLSSARVNKLDYHDKLDLRTDTLFLQAVIQGHKSLYYYESEEGIKNFYIQNGDKISLLEYKKYVKSIDSKDVIAEVRTYPLQLREYFGDCEAIQGSLALLEYNIEKIENLFYDYYEQCSPEKLEFIKRKEKIAFHYSLKAGLTYTKMNFKTGYSYLTRANFKPSIDYTLGIAADIGLSRKKKKWSINSELLYTRYTVKGSYTANTNVIGGRVVTTKLGVSYLKLNTLLKYKYKTENGKSIYFSAGISKALSVNSINERVDVTYSAVGSTTEEGIAVPGVRKFELGRVLGIGYQKSNYSMEIRFEKGSKTFSPFHLGNFTKRFYLLVGYELK